MLFLDAQLPVSSLSVLLVLGSIGIPSIIVFTATIWYQSLRHKELIENLYAWKAQASEKLATLEKELNGKIDGVEKNFMPIIVKMQGTLEHLDNTLKELSSDMKIIKQKNSL